MPTPEQTLQALAASPVVVCIRQSAPRAARDEVEAVLAGGLRAIEITLTTPGALDLVAELSDDDRALVGAGTVLSPEDAEAVSAAGGRFALSPVFDAEVLSRCEQLGLLMVPGTSTPTEMLRAHRAGARLVKVFPIGQLGGPDYLRVVRGPLPQIPLLPTNGVTLESLPAYFAAGAFGVGIGGPALFGGDAREITRRVRAFADAAAPHSR